MRLALIALLFFAGIVQLGAQETGISGHVTDADGEDLIGATVRVLNSVVGTATDLEGHYHLEVPTGRIRLAFSYVGYQTLDTLINVTVSDRDLIINVVMRPAILEGPEVIVYGRQSVGQAQALRVQQSSPQLVSIVHAETFNKYPDVSLGESVQRIPGVTITRRNGEAEFVQIRGLPEQLTIVSLNGQRLPSIRAEADRTSSLDLIQSNLIEEIYVNKSRTANMEADAIGGSIDFRLRQPDDKLEALLQGGLGTNFQNSELRTLDRGVAQFSGYVNSELSEEKVFGLLAGSYFRNGRNFSRQLIERGENGTTGTDVFRYRPSNTDRLAEKIGAIGSIELRPSIYNRLRLGYNFSRSRDQYIQRQAAFDLASLQEFRETTNWKENRDLNLVTLEVESNFNRVRLDYGVSFAATKGDVPERLRFRYSSRINNFNLLPDEPTAEIGIAPVLNLDRLAFERLILRENVAIGNFNVAVFTNEAQNGVIKTGVQYRIKERQFGSISNVVNVAGTGLEVFNGQYGLEGIGADDRGLAFFGLLPAGDLNLFERAGGYESEEEVFSAYLMYQKNWNQQLSSSFGLRLESTELEYRQALDADSTQLNYTNLFPSLNLTYRYALDRQFKFSYYTAIGRPAYASLFPTDQLQSFNQRILRGNQEAEPTYAHNFDLTFERYGRRDGLLTASIYVKLLDDPFVQNSTYEEIDGSPFIVTSISNGESATLVGTELGIIQNLGFVSPFLRKVNVNGNYNFNYTNVVSRDPEQDNLPLAGSPRQNLNLSIVFEDKRFTLVVAGNYRDRTLLREQDGNPIYRADLTTLDLAADFRITDRLSLYTRANNLTNPKIEEYTGKPGETGSQLYAREKLGAWMVAGVRMKM